MDNAAKSLDCWGKFVNTHLKGRIFHAQGTSYLVLWEATDRPEWLRVKALNRQRTVLDMRAEEVERHLVADGRLTSAS